MQPDDVGLLRRARDEGVAQSDEVARAYYPDDLGRQAVAKRYLRDNIQYFLGDEELEGLRTFYRYAADQSLVPDAGSLRFF
jgi:chorismate dehydratase